MKSRKVRSDRDPLENLSLWRDQEEEPSDQVKHYLILIRSMKVTNS